MNFKFYFISIPKSVWYLWPEDLSFEDLAKDALTMKKLIIKGIDRYNKQSNYIKICEHLQSLAIQHLKMHKNCTHLSLERQDAKNYLLLLNKLKNIVANKKINIITCFEKTDSFFGECFYRPGDDVTNQLNLFIQLKQLEEWNEELSSIILKKFNFYQKAHQQNNAVIEVITFN